MSPATEQPVCVIKAKGGMGNRMLCAASGILWARAAGRAPFVDWRDGAYSRGDENAFFHFFATPGVLRDPSPADVDVTPAVWRGNLDSSVSEMFHRYDPDKHSSLTIHRKYSIDPSRAEYASRAVVFWHYLGRFRAVAPLARERLPGYAGLSLEGLTRKALREELPLTPLVTSRIEEFIEQSWADRVIGVHIRHTDSTVNLGKIEGAVRVLLRRVPGASIFLATDNGQIEEEYRRKFPSVISTPKWFPPAGATMHQNAACQDPVANGVEALTDMYLLARCDALAYAGRSTFSEISRLVSDLPGDRVIDIDRRDPTVRAKRLLHRLVT